MLVINFFKIFNKLKLFLLLIQLWKKRKWPLVHSLFVQNKAILFNKTGIFKVKSQKKQNKIFIHWILNSIIAKFKKKKLKSN